jgi:hypothetical protein
MLFIRLKNVIMGGKEDWEIYNSKERVNLVKSWGYETFNQIWDDVYQYETTFTDLSNNEHEQLKHILTDYLNSDII